MKKSTQINIGLSISIIIFLFAAFFGVKIDTGIPFISRSFGTHTTMLFLAILAILLLQKHVRFKIAFPNFKKSLRPILFGILTSIIVMFTLTILTKLLGFDSNEVHPVFKEMDPLQIFVFVFFYASIAEEVLFRGFLMNILHPLKDKGIMLFKRKISFPVIIAAIAFGLGHLIVIRSGVGIPFVFKIVTFTTILGLVAGYYQEKYNNHAYAIIVHMAGNIMGVIGALIMSLNL